MQAIVLWFALFYSASLISESSASEFCNPAADGSVPMTCTAAVKDGDKSEFLQSQVKFHQQEVIKWFQGQGAECEALEDHSTADVSLLQIQMSLHKELWSTSRPESILSNTALQLISGVTERSLLMWNSKSVQVRFEIGSPPPVNAADPLLCQSFHKTGTEVCQEFATARSQVTGEFFDQCFFTEDCVNVAMSGAPNIIYRCYAASCTPVLHFLGDAPFRMLNFIREPVDLILSGYRYHLEAPAGESWLFEPLPVDSEPTFGLKDQAFLLSLCAEGCTYLELLSAVAAVNESAGVLVEAIREKANIKLMTDLTKRFANDPRVLHVSVDHLKKDFNQTMRCINTFLDGKGVEEQQLSVFQSFNPEGEAYLNDRHVTSGKYDNTPLERFLWSQPMWAREFAAHQAFTSQLYQREADRFGCPIP